MNRTAVTLLPVLLLSLLLQGCASTFDPRAAEALARTIDVYRDGQKPSRHYHEIGLLKDDGRLDEQAAIELKMMKQAKSMGGHAIIFLPLVESGTDEASDLFTSTAKPSYLYRGSVLRYE